MTRSIIAPALAASLLFAACGSGAGDSEAPGSAPTTEMPDTSDPAFTESSDPDAEAATSEPATPEPATSDEVEATVSTDASSIDEETDAADDEETDAQVEDDQPTTTAVVGVDDVPTTDVGAGDEPDDFEPSPDDAAFCAGLATINIESGADELLVAIEALRPDVPAVIAGDFDAVIDYIRRVVSGDADFDGIDDDPVAGAPNERISDYIDARCDGDGTFEEAPPVGDEITLESGLVIPVVPYAGSDRSGPLPYFGSEADDGGIPDPEPGFVAAPEDADFCIALDTITRRPQPSEDFQEIIVADVYLRVIRPVVPDAIAADFDILLDWLAELVDAGSFTDAAEDRFEDEIAPAVERLDTFVDERCLGR